MEQKISKKAYVVCVKNEGYPASLELRKIYEVLKDSKADEYNHIRIVDESGEDYLYPADYFMAIELPHAVEEALTLTT